MKIETQLFKANGMSIRTYQSVQRMADYLELAHKLINDPEKNVRQIQLRCKWCFYAPQLGGSTYCESNCGVCGKPTSSSSTAIDLVCMECAGEHKLCLHCGGDAEMRTRRRNWPEAGKGQEK